MDCGISANLSFTRAALAASRCIASILTGVLAIKKLLLACWLFASCSCIAWRDWVLILPDVRSDPSLTLL